MKIYPSIRQFGKDPHAKHMTTQFLLRQLITDEHVSMPKRGPNGVPVPQVYYVNS